ncbi:hypothetical protein MMC21_006054 [Puttea exsequens]|nr:hypothetical protein [Puttea exsequens]
MSTSSSIRSEDTANSSSREEAAEASPDRGKEKAMRGKEEVHVPQVKKPVSGVPQEQSPAAPPLPNEIAPPLPAESSPDDGWDAIWDDNVKAYYFYNRFTRQSQWTNPRVPEDPQPAAPGVGGHDRMDRAPGTEDVSKQSQQRPHGGYDPAIHGDYDPKAPYAQEPNELEDANANGVSSDPSAIYTATGVFNRFTGKWQPHTINPENHNDESKSKRQMNAFFDVDAAANSHNGKSLKAERSGKKLSKQELKAFKEKRKERKEEKRRAWLRD